MKIAFAATLVIAGFPALARDVDVKYLGEFDVDQMQCDPITRSTFIEEVCYDNGFGFMIISLKGVFYAYCRVDPATYTDFMGAESMGRYYNAKIRGLFDCRDEPMDP